MEKPKVITEENFKSQVLSAKSPALVDFWAPWCGPCKIMGPVLEELAGEYEKKVLVGKLNVDENRNLAAKYEVQGIPTLILFKGGEVVNRIVGVAPKETVKKMLDDVLQ